MNHRHLGRSGLRVSALSLGSWVTYHNQVDVGSAAEMLAAAYDQGVNFFDNAEVYAGGRSEEIMGAALKKLGWPRLNYIVSSKSSGAWIAAATPSTARTRSTAST
jgi:aryl-alcohol dehydrogenase-like predicted oxidoreductase